MTNLSRKSLLICSAISLSISSFTASASDCNLTYNTKESIKCLERKISQLESKLQQSQGSLALPQGAVIGFQGKSCPNGWSPMSEHNQTSATQSSDNTVINCLKQKQ